MARKAKKPKGKNGYLGKGTLGKVPGAWRPKPMKKLRKQARRTVNSAYKPAFKDLAAQEKKVDSIAAKRERDNLEWRNWLQSTGEKMRAQDQAASASIQQIQAEQNQKQLDAIANMRENIINSVGNQTGTVSNLQQNVNADVTPELAQAGATGALASTALGQESQLGGDLGDAYRSANLNQMAGIQKVERAEADEARKEIAGERSRLRSEQAASRIAEIGRLLTQEIDKAGSRVDMRNMAATQALGKKAAQLDRRKFRFDRKLSKAQLSEEVRSNMANEALSAQEEARLAREGRQENRDRKADNKRADKELKIDKKDRSGTQAVNAGIGYLQNHPKVARSNPKKAARALEKGGLDPVLAQIAVIRYNGGNVPASLKRKAKQSGYNIPKGW